MLSKQYMIIPLRILFSATLFWHTVPRAEAKEVKVTTETPICKEEQVTDNAYLKSSAKKMQEISKSHSKNKDSESSGQDEVSCQTPEADEVPETAKTSDAETVETPETSEVSPDEDVVEPSNPYSNELSVPNEPNLPQPSVSNQDSHDLNFSIQLNTGGGTSSDSSGSFPEPNTPLPTQPEASPPMPEANLPTTEGNFEQPPEPSRPDLKPPRKKPHKQKAEIEERNKPKKPRKDDKASKRDRLNRRMNKPDRSPLQESEQVNRSERTTNPNTYRNPLKRIRDSETQDKRYRDRLPSMNRKPNVQKQRVKGHRSKLNPIRQRKMRTTIRPNLNRPTDSSPKIYMPRVHRQLPHSLKNRPHLRPRVQQNMSPHKVFRPSAPRIHRIHRRVR
jgi:hypothetical protein